MGGIGSAVGNMFGGGANNSSTTAQSANLMQTVNQGQLNNAQSNVNTGLGNQAALLAQTQGQNGFANQSNVFGQQQNLANMFQQQALGQGPNPALAQLAQSTQAGIANQTAMMAGQGGANQNAGLIARQAAYNQGNTMQQQAGQAATLAAQQQIAASQNLMGQQQNMAGLAQNQIANQANATTGYTTAAQNSQNALLGAAGNLNSSLVSNQSNMNNNNMSMALQNGAETNQMLGGIMNGAGGAIGGLMGGGGSASPFADLGLSKGGMVKARPHTPVHQMPTHIGSVHKMFYGGRARKYDDGGTVTKDTSDNTSTNTATSTIVDPEAAAKMQKSMINAFGGPSPGSGKGYDEGGQIEQETPVQADASPNVAGASIGNAPSPIAPQSSSSSGGGSGGGGGGIMSMLPMLAMMANKGGVVPAMVSPGEGYLTPEKVEAVKKGANPAKLAEKIPGKAKVKGNSPQNDTVHKNLEEGGLVLTRTVMESKNPAKAAHDFVLEHLSKSEDAKKDFKKALKSAASSRKAS